MERNGSQPLLITYTTTCLWTTAAISKLKKKKERARKSIQEQRKQVKHSGEHMQTHYVCNNAGQKKKTE